MIERLIKRDTFHTISLCCRKCSCVNWKIQLFRERLSEKVHATIPKGIVGGFEFTVLSKKFERMAREAMDTSFASAKGKQQK